MPDTDLYSELDSLLDNHDLHLCIVGVKDSKEEESVTIYARQWLDGFGIYPAFRMPPVKPDIDTEAITETVRTIFNGPASTETEEMSITTAEEHPLPVRTSVKRTHCSEEEMIRKRSRTDETKKKIVIPRRLRLRSPQSLQRQINKEVAVKIESPQRDANFLAMKSQPQQQETKDVPRKSKSTSNEQKLTEKRQPTAAGSETNRNDTYNDNKSLLKMLVKRQCKERELKDETLENLVYAGVKHSLRYAMQRQRLNEDRLSPFIMSHIDFFRNMESMGKSFF
ncbi:hypothetical protein BDF20DRAFT_475384 [Mycotypha africana]|uniref:uncharacterized protein n=1 Tax=Mycotypha africana TaxID=64632 RepID=UPI002300F0F0|nr:uncharacterized protein BDF20DRAFT_475384 [Mycotypha africana]KAI8982474.1 hypothetical protein BDF20DRAFT_475384 [Mycotypha africana]